MKTKVLIQKLQEADPSGEIECCIDNADISVDGLEPAYYDGLLQIVDRDEDDRPTRGRRISAGQKLNLSALHISDLHEYPGFSVEYASEDQRERYEKFDQERARSHRQIDFDVERDIFCRWVFIKIQTQKPIPLGWVERIKAAAEAFYTANRGPDVDGKVIRDRKWGYEKGSWADRLHELWQEIIHVEWDDYSRIIIRFKQEKE